MAIAVLKGNNCLSVHFRRASSIDFSDLSLSPLIILFLSGRFIEAIILNAVALCYYRIYSQVAFLKSVDIS